MLEPIVWPDEAFGAPSQLMTTDQDLMTDAAAAAGITPGQKPPFTEEILVQALKEHPGVVHVAPDLEPAARRVFQSAGLDGEAEGPLHGQEWEVNNDLPEGTWGIAEASAEEPAAEEPAAAEPTAEPAG